MNRFVRFMLSGRILPSLLITAALCTGAGAQTTKHKVPTSPEAAMQKKPDFKGHQRVMQGTNNTDRWHVAIKHADHRAARARAQQKAVK